MRANGGMAASMVVAYFSQGIARQSTMVSLQMASSMVVAPTTYLAGQCIAVNSVKI